MKPKPEFRSVSIKAELIQEIEDFVKNGKRYRSIADFITEAARLRLEQLEKHEKREEP